jgi:DNA repair ATPase RecN
MASTIEMASLGYKKGAREQETRRTPAKPTLSNVMGVLHYHFAELLVSPPTKQEARFLSKDMQTLLRDLELADKGMQAIPRLEQNIKDIESQMYEAIANMKPDKYNQLELSLKNEKESLANIQQKVKDSIRAANIYNENNPGDIAKSRDMLKTLRTELSSAYSYQEAKDNLPTHTKTVVQWLDDLKDKASLDDRIVAKKVLDGGGVDAKSLLTEVERQNLSLTDRAVAEMRDGEAGTASTEKPQKGHESPGQ